MTQFAGVRRRWLVATIAYIGLIFFVSSRPYLHAPGPEFDLKDKLAHALEYGGLTFLLWRALAPALARDRLIAALALVAVVAVLASGDELFQSTIPGRLMDLHDWFADLTGAAVAATACLAHAARTPRVRVAEE